MNTDNTHDHWQNVVSEDRVWRFLIEIELFITQREEQHPYCDS